MKKIDLKHKRKELEALLKPFQQNPNYYSTKKSQIQLIKDEISRHEKKEDEAQREIKKIKEEMFSPYSDFSNKEKGTSFEFLKILDVRFCPYCNINDTIVVFDENEKKICRPDIDHFLSQSDYPEKQLELENLVPSCLLCNQRLKGDFSVSTETHLNPYKSDFDDLMEFSLVLKAPNYLFEDNFEIQIHKKNNANAKEVVKAEGNIQLFKLRERYQYYKSEIIPLMKNIDFYTRSKRHEIEKLFNDNCSVPFRTVLFPEENCDINNTRLGKLKKDIIKKYAKHF